MMSRIERVETEIMQMSPEEFAAFRTWLADYEFAAWDRQIEADDKAGKLDRLAAEAMQEYDAGLTTEI